jgi:hypothetical protein
MIKKIFLTILFLFLVLISTIHAGYNKDITAAYIITNKTSELIETIEYIACIEGKDCQRFSENLYLDPDQTSRSDYVFSSENNPAIISCEIYFENGKNTECIQKKVEPGDTVIFELTAESTSKITGSADTQLSNTDVNKDCAVNAMDYAQIFISHGQVGKGHKADVNDDGVVNATDLSICIKWLGRMGICNK